MSPAAAKAFLEASGARYAFSEQKMRLETPVKHVSPDNHLDCRQATIEDADAIAQIISDDSGMDAAFFRQAVANGIRNRSRWYYIAKLDGQTIGTINVDVIENLFSTDLAYLQEFYRKINEEGGAPKHHITCPKCQHEMDVDMVTGGLITEGGGSGQSGPG